ncbi:MAG: aldose 1-epimerase family protein [Clostridia bacterium]|nr:aldose 1-epimerase family protein [Clostridia bacterium]
MKHYIENEYAAVCVKEPGAELSSFRSKASGREYLWQGDPDVWYGQSPLLFPIVGTLLNNKCLVDGKEYEMFRHGIARKRDFIEKASGDAYVILTQSYDDETLKRYPYKYSLDIEYRLDGKKLTAGYTVYNADDKTMYFSIGAHPGFNCAIGDYLEFDEPETLKCEKINELAVLDGKLYPTLENSRRFDITEHVFDDDAHILSGMKSESLRIVSAAGKPYISFDFGKVPYLGLWAKPGAEYICIEPWYGINDSMEPCGDISQKRGIIPLEPGREFVFSWSAEFIE